MKKHILIIEDDFDHQFIFLKELSKITNFSIEFTTAYSIEEAIEKISNNQFDLVLADINMGENSIFSFLKEDKSNIIQKTLILTTSTHKKDILRSKRYGIIGYIIKPYSSNPNFVLLNLNQTNSLTQLWDLKFSLLLFPRHRLEK